jgi:hypothetical protein
MAKGARKNQGRRVASPLAASDYTPPGMDKVANSAEGIKEQTEWYGKQRAQLVDIANQLESIFTLQQNQRREVDQMYGIEKKMLDNLGYMANQVKMIAIQKQLTRDLSLQESNILKTTLSDYESYNQEAAAVAKTTRELLSFRKQQVPFEEKIKRFTSEISSLQTIGVANLTTQEKTRLASLQTLEKQYKALSKQEQMNQRIEKAQASINDLMSGQHSAAGKIFDTLKDIVTNPLALFTGLLAVGLQRYEQMRQRGNELAEEMDRVNKKLAGAGPFQDKILAKASLIKRRFYEMGEGFSSSLEGAVDAIVALESQFGKVDYVSGKLVKTMAELKLSIGLSDDEAAKVLDNFSMIGGLTDEAAVNMTNLTYQMSEQAGLNPQEIFKDIAAASGDTLASFSGTSTELARSAVTARRLGLTLNDMAQVSSSLLDFETSIEKEMEAQLITGIDLNLQKARMLAMQGDEAGAMEEVMKQVGGLDRFNKMAPHQQRALAEAVGLTVGQLQKSSAQREREAKHAQMQHDLVTKQYKLAEAALPMLGKLDAGLGVMERIAKVIGDLFLNVFGVGIKDLEKTFFKFLESPAFKTGFKNMLFLIKGIVLGIKDAVVQVAGWIDSLSGGAIGGFLKDFSSKDFSGSYGKSEQIGKSIGKGVALMLGASKLLGATPLTAMWVRMSEGMGGLGELLGLGGSAGKFYKGGQYMPGGMRAPVGGMMAGGRTLMGMNLGAGLGGASGGVGTALGGTMLGTAGAALGAAGAIGSIGMGIYDVSQLDGKSTARDKATARGGLGGAAGGAAAGALIGSVVPVIGTLLGAGIGGILGYFGGRSIGSMDAFRDELDTARDRAQEASEDKSNAIEAYQHRVQLDAMRGSLQVGNAFRNLSGGMKELSGKKMKEFGELLIEQGKIGKDAFRQFAKDGKITMSELQKIQASVSDNILNMGNKRLTTIIDKVDENLEYQMIPLLQKQIQMLDTLGSGESDMAARAISQLSLKELQVMISGQGHVTQFETTRSAITKEELEKIIIAQAQITDLTKSELTTIFKAYNEGAETKEGEWGSSEQLQSGLVAAFNALAMKRESALQNLMGERDGVITTELNKVENAVGDNNPVDISTASIKSLNKDKENTITFELDPALMEKMLYNPTDRRHARGGVLAKGGITYGPSHAQGGIPTRYGELEGGEAVINKRSTAMYGGLLSQINQAGGGVTFGDGGVTGKRFAKGGLTSAITPEGLAFSEKVYGVWTKSIPRHWVTEQEVKGMDVTPGRDGTVPRSATGNWMQTELALDTIEAYEKQFGRPWYNKIGMYHQPKSTNSRHTPHISDPDRKKDYWGNAMAKSTNPVAMKVYNGMKIAGEWVTALGGTLIGATSGLIPFLIKNAFGLMANTAKASINLAGTGALQMLTGRTVLAKLMGGLKSYTGVKMLLTQGSAVKNLVKGKGSLNDIASVFLGGKKTSWFNSFAKTSLAIRDKDYVKAALTFLPGLEKYKQNKDTFTTVKQLYSDLTKWWKGDSEGKNLALEAGFGVLPLPPIKKVNDMILTKDGQMIETHADDNLIAKKGAITQTSSGGNSRVEELLLELIAVTRQSGNVYMDGAKVSAAINQVNYNA